MSRVPQMLLVESFRTPGCPARYDHDPLGSEWEGRPSWRPLATKEHGRWLLLLFMCVIFCCLHPHMLKEYERKENGKQLTIKKCVEGLTSVSRGDRFLNSSSGLSKLHAKTAIDFFEQNSGKDKTGFHVPMLRP